MRSEKELRQFIFERGHSLEGYSIGKNTVYVTLESRGGTLGLLGKELKEFLGATTLVLQGCEVKSF